MSPDGREEITLEEFSTLFPNSEPWEYRMRELEKQYIQKANQDDNVKSESDDDLSECSSAQDFLPMLVASWQEHCRNGIIAFRAGKYESAVECFDKAIDIDRGRFQLYDSRAAALEKLGKFKQALRDSRKTIDLEPIQCHGYLRSAYLFLHLKRYDSASSMVRFALERVDTLSARRLELEGLQRQISEAKKTHDLVTPGLHLSGLPVELIAEIFLLSAKMDSAFPVVACGVSRRWRSVALSIPSLWQCVTLSYRNPVKKLMLWMKRSKHRITRLQIQDSISWLQLHDVLGACEPVIFKSLKSINCIGPVQFLTDRLLETPNVFQDLDLEDIYLSQPHSQVYNVYTSLGPFIPRDRMSKARSLFLENISVVWTNVAPRLSQLRSLIVRCGLEILELGTLCELLSGNPQMETLILETILPMPLDDKTGTDRIVLPRLSHLELLGPVFTESLLARLSVPSLERFAISRCTVSADQAMFALEPSYVVLTELSINNCYFREKRLAPLLQTMSRLTKLEITHSASNIDALVYIVADNHHISLKHVDFSYCTNLNGGPIFRLVTSRLTERTDGLSTLSHVATPTRIETVYIDGCPNIDPSLPQWLRTTVSNVSCVYMTKKEAKQTQLY